MLPARSRLRTRADFADTLRRGRRAGRAALVVALLPGTPRSPATRRAGFVVGRRVGNAVTRNRVRRRLRHLVAARLDRLPPGARLVVRALPPSAELDSASLGEELDRLLARVR